MERRTFETPLGQVWLWAPPGANRTDRPALLAMTGAFSRHGRFEPFVENLPEFDVFLAHLPGNHCPALIDQSVATFVRGFDAALEMLGRPVVVCGASLGGTVAAGL